MNKSTLSFYREIIKGNKLSKEYSKFKDMLQGNRADHSKAYSDDEKVIYLFPFKQDSAKGNAYIDPSSESYAVSFYEKIKKITLAAEKKSIENIRSNFESRQRRKDGKAYLNYLYDDCMALIESYQNSPEDAELKEYPIIIDSLKRVKEFLNRLIENEDFEETSKGDNSEIHGEDLPKLIKEFAENCKVDPRTQMTLEAIEVYITLYERYKEEPNFDALITRRMDELNLDYTSPGARSKMKDKWVKFRDFRTTD